MNLYNCCYFRHVRVGSWFGSYEMEFGVELIELTVGTWFPLNHTCVVGLIHNLEKSEIKICEFCSGNQKWSMVSVSWLHCEPTNLYANWLSVYLIQSWIKYHVALVIDCSQTKLKIKRLPLEIFEWKLEYFMLNHFFT